METKKKNYLRNLRILSFIPFFMALVTLAFFIFYFIYFVTKKDNTQATIESLTKNYYDLNALQKERLESVKLFHHTKDAYKHQFSIGGNYEGKLDPSSTKLLQDIRDNIKTINLEEHHFQFDQFSIIINEYILKNIIKKIDVDSDTYSSNIEVYVLFLEYAEALKKEGSTVLDALFENTPIESKISVLNENKEKLFETFKMKLPKEWQDEVLSTFHENWFSSYNLFMKNKIGTTVTAEDIKKLENILELMNQSIHKSNFLIKNQIIKNMNSEKNLNIWVLIVVGVLTLGLSSFLLFLGQRIRKEILEDINGSIKAANKKNDTIERLLAQVDENVILSTTDLKGRIKYVSEAFCKVAEYKKEELLGKPHNIVRHPDMPAAAFKEMWDMIQTEGTWEGQVKNKTKSGGYYWVYAKVTQEIEDGEVIGYVSVRQDITAHKKAQELISQINNLLNNVNQGFLSFGSDLKIDSGYSKESLRILNIDSLVDKNIVDVLFPEDNHDREVFAMGIENLFGVNDGDINDMYLSLLPKENRLGDITYTIDYKKIDNSRYMVILEDVTEKRKLEEKIVYENKIQKMIVVIATRKQEFLDLKHAFEQFLDDITSHINMRRTVGENLTEFNKILHTFKGLFAQEELVNTTEAIHNLESSLLEMGKRSDLSNLDLISYIKSSSLRYEFEKDLQFIGEILGNDFFESNSVISVDETSFKNFEDSIRHLNAQKRISNKEVGILLKQFINLDQKSLKNMLEIYPKRVQNIADRLQKPIQKMIIEGDSNVLVQATTSSFIKSLVHLFRNMADHGIEEENERVRLGKSEVGTIGCKFDYYDDKYIELTIYDDGAGINPDKVRLSAVEKGIITPQEADEMEYSEIIDLIFHENFSTKAQTDILSGRGIGLSVIKYEIEKIGGSVEVKSELEKGTEFNFKIPRIIALNDAIDENKDASEQFLLQTEEYIKQNIILDIKNIDVTDEISYGEYFSVIGLNGEEDLFFVMSAEDTIIEELAKVFMGEEALEFDDDKAQVYESIIDETLNTIIGLARLWFAEKYKDFDLTPPLHLEKNILQSFENTNTTYSYTIETTLGRLNLGVIFVIE